MPHSGFPEAQGGKQETHGAAEQGAVMELVVVAMTEVKSGLR